MALLLRLILSLRTRNEPFVLSIELPLAVAALPVKKETPVRVLRIVLFRIDAPLTPGPTVTPNEFPSLSHSTRVNIPFDQGEMAIEWTHEFHACKRDVIGRYTKTRLVTIEAQ